MDSFGQDLEPLMLSRREILWSLLPLEMMGINNSNDEGSEGCQTVYRNGRGHRAARLVSLYTESPACRQWSLK